MHFAGLGQLGLLGIQSFGAVKNTGIIDSITKGASLTTNLNPNGPIVGTCTPDGQFIYDKTTDGSIFTRRLRVGETCQGTSGANPTIRSHNTDGSVTVTNPDGSTYTIPPVVSSTNDARTLKAEHLKRALLADQISALNAKALIATGVLPPCDPSTYVSGGAAGLYACYPVSNEQYGLAPMTFVAYGTNVVFTVNELIKDQGFKRDYAPNDDQTFWTAWYIYLSSKSLIMDQYASYWASRLVAGSNVNRDQINNPSINDMIAAVHDANVSIPGFAWNPPSPTDAELNNPGGLATWLARGGWLISYQIVSGATRLGDAWTMAVATNLPCACQTNRVETADNIAAKRDFTINGIAASWPLGYVDGDGNIRTSGVGDANNPPTWETYIDIVSNPNVWHCEVRHQDPAWYTKVATVLGQVLEDIAKVICAAGPSFSQGLNTLAATKCVDKNNKVCKQGSAGCTCVTPPSSVTLGVGLTNWWLSEWCSEFANELNNYTNPTSQQPVAPPGSVSKTIIPSWLIWLGLAMTVGVAYKYSQSPSPKPKALPPASP